MTKHEGKDYLDEIVEFMLAEEINEEVSAIVQNLTFVDYYLQEDGTNTVDFGLGVDKWIIFAGYIGSDISRDNLRDTKRYSIRTVKLDKGGDNQEDLSEEDACQLLREHQLPALKELLGYVLKREYVRDSLLEMENILNNMKRYVHEGKYSKMPHLNERFSELFDSLMPETLAADSTMPPVLSRYDNCRQAYVSAGMSEESRKECKKRGDILLSEIRDLEFIC